MICRKWSEWKTYATSLMEKRDVTIDEYTKCLEHANSLIIHLGNPSNRVYSVVCSLRMKLNETNIWRSRVHDYFYQKEHNKEGIEVEELTELWEGFPPNGLMCEEYEWVSKLYQSVQNLEAEIRNE